MSEQPGGVLDEAAKLLDALIGRAGGGGGRDGRAHRGDDAGDAWDRATAGPPDETPDEGPHGGGPHIATGAPECRDCPVCRAIAIKRASGDDVERHLREAGRSLLAAALDVVAAFDRTASDRAASGREASRGPRAGTSDRPGRPEPGGPWSAATGGPIDIG